ncbi:MAG: T9SS type A sorting domain-containing protein [bacterium]
MKRISILTAVTLLWLLAFGVAHGVNEITLDAVTNSNGGDSAITGGWFPVGDTIKFTYRWTYEDGTKVIGASSNGFQVYEATRGANFYMIEFDTVSGCGLGSRYNFFSFNDFSVSGTGRDTIGFGGYAVAPGIEIGYDSAVWYIETGSDNAGDSICIDSSFYPPGGVWIWSPMGGGTPTIPAWYGPDCFHVGIPTDVPYDEQELPKTYALSQNYPNPFNPSTEIKFELPYRSHVTLTVYNVLGQKVITLIDADMQAGRYPVRWEGTAGDGKEVASGVYFYKLEADDFVSTKKMMLLK